MTAYLIALYYISANSWSRGQPYCPVCGITLQPHELEEHVQVEIESLEEFYRQVKVAFNPLVGKEWGSMKEERHKRFTPDVCHMKHCGSRLADRRPPVARWETYLRVRSNRHVRISTRNLKPRRRTPDVVLQDMTENKDHDIGEHSFVESMDTGQNTVETDSCKMPETEENSTVNIRLASTKTEDPSPEAK
ncbi:uncharacterized protein LOC143245613 [Tachypleus tridentatus]|uniref:uncharacterized protein LOC143245613 n=1 Tax=Tachypleus tridentatus TaxID=6853 RepID=UPI003FD1A04A